MDKTWYQEGPKDPLLEDVEAREVILEALRMKDIHLGVVAANRGDVAVVAGDVLVARVGRPPRLAAPMNVTLRTWLRLGDAALGTEEALSCPFAHFRDAAPGPHLPDPGRIPASIGAHL